MRNRSGPGNGYNQCYLARYTHRVAIGNQRIRAIDLTLGVTLHNSYRDT